LYGIDQSQKIELIAGESDRPPHDGHHERNQGERQIHDPGDQIEPRLRVADRW